MVPRQFINPQGRSIAALDVHSLRAQLRTIDAAAHRITKEIDVLLDKLAT
jgi:hypothetical protein